jgi:transcriptional regulator with XRE-family HTH domain
MYSNFEKLLKIKGVTSFQVAKATGITPSTFTEWKKGSYVPKSDKLQKIADYFDVTIDYLMGHNKFVVDDLEMEFIDIVREAKRLGYSPEDLKLAMSMLDMARGKK